MESFLQDYTPVAIALVTLTAGGFGYILREIIGNIYSKKKEARDLKAFLWKEKIQAAKKASEFYYQQLNFLELAYQQTKLDEPQQELHKDLIQSINNDLESLRQKIYDFSHYEYHHIQIFYEIDGEIPRKLVSKLFDIGIKLSDKETAELDIVDLTDLIKDSTKQRREILTGLIDFYKSAIKLVRDDINTYLYK